MKKNMIRFVSLLLLASTASSSGALPPTGAPTTMVLQTGAGPAIVLDHFSFGVHIETRLITGGGSVPGKFEWLPLRITSGIVQIDNPFFLQWEADMLLGGSGSLRDLSIEILDDGGNLLYQWDLTDVWLSEVETFFTDNDPTLGTQQYSLIVSSAVWISAP